MFLIQDFLRVRSTSPGKEGTDWEGGKLSGRKGQVKCKGTANLIPIALDVFRSLQGNFDEGYGSDGFALPWRSDA